MARSLTVEHEENVSTSPLLTGFLLFAVIWLMFGALIGSQLDAEPQPADVATE